MLETNEILLKKVKFVIRQSTLDAITKTANFTTILGYNRKKDSTITLLYILTFVFFLSNIISNTTRKSYVHVIYEVLIRKSILCRCSGASLDH